MNVICLVLFQTIIKNECKDKCRFDAFNATSCLSLKRTFTYFSVPCIVQFFLSGCESFSVFGCILYSNIRIKDT